MSHSQRKWEKNGEKMGKKWEKNGKKMGKKWIKARLKARFEARSSFKKMEKSQNLA